MFLDPEVDFTLDFKHYLPKISSIGLDANGNFILYDGVSQLDPKEPDFPGDLVKLFVLDQEPYVFNLIDGIKVKVVPNKRFTMKDIGKIEDRVKTLEYYTSLNLLERDAEQTQIQDSLGFDRFKNGFVVDSFTGHGVGDSIENPDYATSINFKKREAGPLTRNSLETFIEVNSLRPGSRSSNNYVITNDVLSLPYTEEVVLQNTFSSKTNNLNPFNIGQYQGLVTLTPPGDIFFDDKRVPNKFVDRLGTFDSLQNASLIKKDGKNIFGSISDIEQFNSGTVIDTEQLPDNFKSLADVVGAITPTTTSVQLTGNEVVKNTSIIPKMRSVSIDFNVSGLRPNTNMFAFFDDLNVSSFCTLKTTAIVTGSTDATANSNVQTLTNLANAQLNSSNVTLTTDSTGSLSGTFFYNADSLNLDVGKKVLRFTNSSTNNKDGEISFGEAIFFSDGIVREIFKEVLRPPPPPPPEPDPQPVVTTNTTSVPNQSTTTKVSAPRLIDKIYMGAANRPVDPSGEKSWIERFPVLATTSYGVLDTSAKKEVQLAISIINQGFINNANVGKEDKNADTVLGNTVRKQNRNTSAGVGGDHYDDLQAKIAMDKAVLDAVKVF